ncbi:MAG: helicase-related protein [Solirubrobacteraceae bacterium]
MNPPTIAEQAAIADYIIDTVVDDATGRANGDRCLGEPPSAHYFLGTLAPGNLQLAAGAVRRGREAPHAAGLEFDVDDPAAELLLDARVSVYYRVLPTLAEQLDFHGGADDPTDRPQRTYRLAPAFQRADVEIRALSIALDPNARTASFGAQEFRRGFADVQRRVAQDPDVFCREAEHRGPQDIPGSALDSEEAFAVWKQSLPGVPVVPDWHAQIAVSLRPVHGGRLRVGAMIENTSLDPTIPLVRKGERVDRHDDARDHFLFRVQLDLRPRRGRIVPIEMNLGPDAYRYDGRLPAYASNCGVVAEWAEDETIASLRTVPAPVHETYRTPSREHPASRFSVLAEYPLPALETLAAALEEYQSDPAWSTEGMPPDHAARKGADREAFGLEIARFKEGIRWLRKDERLLRAFRLANRTMVRLNDRPGGYDAWRLFQIVFIVSQLPALAWREFPPEDFTPGLWGDADGRDPSATATVLWFPTAGGKTEATLGAIACALFYDRCRGKTRGVTAWSRYPLRLLSLQQTQRYLNFVVAADQVREASAAELEAAGGGLGDRFAVGFYVGAANTLNALTRDAETVNRLIADPARRREQRIVDECPYCAKRAVEVLPPDPTELRLVHACTECGRELPLHTVDHEIYRYLPSVVLGTIDKLAMIGLSDRFGALLGDVDCECQLHGFGRGMKCHERRMKGHPQNAVSSLKSPLYDPSPSLEIVDELHMVREELGVFAGHYEGVMAVIQEQLSSRQRADGRGVRMKVLATTATIRGEDRQCEHLFGLPSVVVPLPGPALDHSFYWSVDREAPMRRYVGVLPHRVTAEMALVRVLVAFHQGVRRLESEGPSAIPALAATPPERFRELVEWYRISLTYLTSLLDFGKLRRSMQTQVNEYLRSQNLREVSVRELSGDTSFDEVRATLDELESGGDTEAVIATSMISHGVDVAQLNVMVFNGMPKSMAEYIQASSRIGRNMLGVVFMIFNPIRERDRSHFRYHGKFHEYLDRMVEPVAINRWSRYAARKTLPGVFMAELLQTGNRAFWDAGSAPRHLHDLTRMQQALRPPEAGGLEAVQLEALLEALRDSYLADRDGASELREELVGQIETAVSSIRAAGAAAGAAVGRGPTYRATGDYLGLQYEPMTSLRDVAKGLPFHVLQERRRP